MSTCKDCLHYEVCECEDCLIRAPEWVNKVEDFCGCFKPKADYVEVVRCGECKFACFKYNTDKYPFGLYACKKQPTGRAYKKVKGNHFCSYGERKESEVTE